MKVTNLDGATSTLHYNKSVGSNKSQLHLQCRELLNRLFPTVLIFEETPIEVHAKEILYLDFFIPSKLLALEVQGEQHFKFTLHFHGNKWNYMLSKQRDLFKKQWCELNNIRLVELPFNDINNWSILIKE